MRRVSSHSGEYMTLPISTLSGQDPSIGTTVEVAFEEPDEWDPSTFALGDWFFDSVKNVHYARRLTTGLEPGKYRMWVKILSAAPQAPILFSETLFEVI